MKRDFDEAIERVFAGLREAEASEQMERRILVALEGLEAARSRSGWRGWSPLWLVASARPVARRSLVCGVLLAGLIVALLAIPGVRRHERGTAMSEISKTGAAPVGQGSSEATRLAERRTPFPQSGQSASSMRRIGGATAKSQRLVDVSDSVGDSGGDANDSVALRESRAPSRPAPSLPLTEQERLLLRIVHRGDPEEMAMLNPEVRSRREAEGKTEFQSFFEESTTGDSK